MYMLWMYAVLRLRSVSSPGVNVCRISEFSITWHSCKIMFLSRKESESIERSIQSAPKNKHPPKINLCIPEHNVLQAAISCLQSSSYRYQVNKPSHLVQGKTWIYKQTPDWPGVGILSWVPDLKCGSWLAPEFKPCTVNILALVLVLIRNWYIELKQDLCLYAHEWNSI